jgi:hypothetical protein
VEGETSIVCEESVLRLRFPAQEIEFHWRPEPLCRQRRRNTDWHALQPDWRILSPDPDFVGDSLAIEPDPTTAASRAAAWRAWRAGLPEPIARAVEPFRSHQWSLLVALDGEPALLALCEANPLLAWALANNGFFRARREDVSAALAVRHEHDSERGIATWLGFPDRSHIAPLLARIRPEALTLYDVRVLRAVLADADGLAWLQGAPVVTAGVVRLLAAPALRRLVTSDLVREVSAADDRYGAAASDAVLETLKLREAMHETSPLAPFESLRAIVELRATVRARHREWSDRRGGRPERRPRGFLRPPPVPGTAAIVPLDTVAALAAEGRSQRNRASQWVARVRTGDAYVYRVLQPARATLMLVPCEQGWRIGELSMEGGERASAAVYQAVNEWLVAQGHGRES